MKHRIRKGPNNRSKNNQSSFIHKPLQQLATFIIKTVQFTIKSCSPRITFDRVNGFQYDLMWWYIWPRRLDVCHLRPPQCYQSSENYYQIFSPDSFISETNGTNFMKLRIRMEPITQIILTILHSYTNHYNSWQH